MSYDVSVVMATLNAAAYVSDAIESIRDQAGVTVELIVIDGGSTDETLALIRNGLVGSTVKPLIVSQTGSGIYSAMNQGLRLAAAPVICILNADDWLLPGALARVCALFKLGRADVIAGHAIGLRHKDGNEACFPLRSSWPCTVTGMSVIHPATFAKKIVYEQFGLFDETFGLSGDYDFFSRLSAAGVSVSIIPDRLAVFRTGGASSKRLWRLLWEDRRVRTRWYGRCAAELYFFRHVYRYLFAAGKDMVLRRVIGSARLELIRTQRMRAKYPAINSAESSSRNRFVQDDVRRLRPTDFKLREMR